MMLFIVIWGKMFLFSTATHKEGCYVKGKQWNFSSKRFRKVTFLFIIIIIIISNNLRKSSVGNRHSPGSSTVFYLGLLDATFIDADLSHQASWFLISLDFFCILWVSRMLVVSSIGFVSSWKHVLPSSI